MNAAPRFHPPVSAPYLIAFLLIVGLVWRPSDAVAAFRKKPERKPGPAIVGFLPDYHAKAIDSIPFKLLTDAIYFSISPTWNGELDLDKLDKKALKDFVKQARKEDVQTFICVGGWQRSGGFRETSRNSVARERFAHELAEFCKKYKLAGADLDWEHPTSTEETKNYNLLIAEVAKKFREKKLSVTVSVHARGRMLRPATFPLVDRIHVMSYDHRGPHSTSDAAGGDMRHWREQGAPRSKLILGIPFYGRNAAGEAAAYRDLIRRENVSPDKDTIGGHYFNNLATVRLKTKLTLEHGYGGVMVWELSQDAAGRQSLLRAIYETAQQETKAPAPPDPAR